MFSKVRIKKILFSIIAAILLVIVLFSGYASTIYFRNNDVTVVGDIDQADGLGRQTIDAMKIMLKHNIKPNLIEMRWIHYKGAPLSVIMNTFFSNKKLGPVVLYEHFLPLDSKEEEVFMAKLFLGEHSKDIDKRIYIAYSMFESSKILDRWVRILNESFDMVVVPSKFLIKVYQDSGVNIPIFYLPLGMNMDYELSLPLKTERNEIFRFGNFSGLQFRKNTLSLVKAFEKSFKNNKNVELIINSRYADKEAYDEIVDYIAHQGISNIKLGVKKLKQKNYNKLLSTIDCFVYVSKGEGFSVQPREAMALGVPVILTDNTAQHDIVESNLVRAVKSDIEVPARYSFTSEAIGNNYDFNIDDAAIAMKDVYNNYNKYLEQSENAREWVKSYQYARLEKKYLNMINPKDIRLGDKNEITDDYIMTSSKVLYNKLRKVNLNESK